MKAVFAGAALAASVAANEVAVSWEDCGKGTAHVTVKDFKPASLTLGKTTTMVGSGILDEDISMANFDLEMTGSIGKLLSCKGDASQSKTCRLPLGTGSLTFEAMKFPIKQGPNEVKVGISLSSHLPPMLEKTTTLAMATAADGGQLFCMKIMTAPAKTSDNFLAPVEVLPRNGGCSSITDPAGEGYECRYYGCRWCPNVGPSGSCRSTLDPPCPQGSAESAAVSITQNAVMV